MGNHLLQCMHCQRHRLYAVQHIPHNLFRHLQESRSWHMVNVHICLTEEGWDLQDVCTGWAECEWPFKLWRFQPRSARSAWQSVRRSLRHYWSQCNISHGPSQAGRFQNRSASMSQCVSGLRSRNLQQGLSSWALAYSACECNLTAAAWCAPGCSRWERCYASIMTFGGLSTQTIYQTIYKQHISLFL